MAVNRGKDFEKIIRKAFEHVDGVSIDRLNDNTAGFKGIAGICDFIVYKKPYEYYIECKSVHGNTLPFSNITDRQWNGLLEKSKIEGVKSGIICWWCDKDVTKFIPIQMLEIMKTLGEKSIRFDNSDIYEMWSAISIVGTKKRVFYDYDMTTFFKEVENEV